MKIREIFNKEVELEEAISIGHEQHRIFNTLEELSNKKLSDICNIELTDTHLLVRNGRRQISLRRGSQPKDLPLFFNKMIKMIGTVADNTLSKVATEIIGRPITVEFAVMNSQANASYNKIKINIQIERVRKFVEDLIIGLEQNGYVNSAGYVNLMKLYEILWVLSVGFFPVVQKNLLPNMTSSIIHELVHIHQRTKQGDPTITSRMREYRSKLVSKDEFLKVMHRLTNKQGTDEDRKVYHSSLQEIPAFAHEVAIELNKGIAFPTDGKVGLNGDNEVRKKVGELIALTGRLSNSKFTRSDFNKSELLKYYISNFNHPEDKLLYPVYKRFIKLLYQELVNYINYWNDQLKAYETKNQGR